MDLLDTITSRVETITPALATTMLARVAGNGRVDKGTQHSLERDMREGRWVSKRSTRSASARSPMFYPFVANSMAAPWRRHCGSSGPIKLASRQAWARRRHRLRS